MEVKVNVVDVLYVFCDDYDVCFKVVVGDILGVIWGFVELFWKLDVWVV